jgi:tetratricopeptide (TPR) repeat protein
VARTGGPRAGLVAYRALLGAADATVRGQAILAALGCAVTLRDRAAITELLRPWPAVDRGVWVGAVSALCARLGRAGMPDLATHLAAAEALRHRTARSLYLHARCKALAGEPDADVADAYREAAHRASNEGAHAIEAAARARRLTLLARSWATLGEALAEATNLDASALPVPLRLSVARVLLLSPSRFVRASAIATADALVTEADEATARRTLEVVAAWVDDASGGLSALERDRLVALFGRPRATALASRAAELMRALERILGASHPAALDAALDQAAELDPALRPFHARARDILGGRFEAVRDRVGEATPLGRHGELLDLAAALRDHDTVRAARALRSLAEAEARGEPLSPSVFGMAYSALVEDAPELRAVAVLWFEAWLARPRLAVPRGLLALAGALAQLGRDDLALTARQAAVVAREEGAAEALGATLARRGWDLAQAGDREAAITALREARRILTPPGATPPAATPTPSL